MKRRLYGNLAAFCFFILLAGCKKNSSSGNGNPVDPGPDPVSEMDMWLTTGDKSSLLQKQSSVLVFGTQSNSFPMIEVDSTQTFQAVNGFGYTLTGGSADVMAAMAPAARTALLQELFGNGPSSNGVSYLRVSIGASDLSAQVFSYDDLPAGNTDTALLQFSLAADTVNLVPVLKEILAIRPGIKILGSPWSAPLWMKDNGQSKGGRLLPVYYAVYAKYFVRYIQAMAAKGITIDAITVQNEPENGNNNPSMLMSAAEETDFVKYFLGPAFAAAQLNTKIIIWDHNCDNPGYPLAVLSDPAAKSYIDGSAFHLYAGDISALSQVHNAHPDRNVYFTEQYTSSAGNFATDLKWHMRNVIIGSMRNWSRNALAWNLANDPSIGPHTSGGCTQCLGALTIGSNVVRNVSYYTIAHASRFVPPGSVRISSGLYGSIQDVAFLRPDGKKVLLVENDGSQSQTFNIKYKGKWVTTTLGGGAIATYIW